MEFLRVNVSGGRNAKLSVKIQVQFPSNERQTRRYRHLSWRPIEKCGKWRRNCDVILLMAFGGELWEWGSESWLVGLIDVQVWGTEYFCHMPHMLHICGAKQKHERASRFRWRGVKEVRWVCLLYSHIYMNFIFTFSSVVRSVQFARDVALVSSMENGQTLLRLHWHLWGPCSVARFYRLQ